MSSDILKKAFSAGRTYHEKPVFIAILTMIALLVDSVLTYCSFESVSSDIVMLKAFGAIGSIFLLDYPPTLLGEVIFKKMKPAIKVTLIVLLSIVILVIAGLLAKFRLETVGNMFYTSTGLTGELEVTPAIKTLGYVLAVEPLGTSIVLFCLTVYSHNRKKAWEERMQLKAKLVELANEYEAALKLYSEVGSTGAKNHLMEVLVNFYKVADKVISLSADLNDKQFARMLCEHLGAVSEQVEALME